MKTGEDSLGLVTTCGEDSREGEVKDGPRKNVWASASASDLAKTRGTRAMSMN